MLWHESADDLSFSSHLVTTLKHKSPAASSFWSAKCSFALKVLLIDSIYSWTSFGFNEKGSSTKYTQELASISKVKRNVFEMFHSRERFKGEFCNANKWEREKQNAIKKLSTRSLISYERILVIDSSRLLGRVLKKRKICKSKNASLS